MAGQSVWALILTGIVAFAVAALPVKLIALVDRVIPLGSKAATQEIVYGLDWGTLGFWIFTAVGSFLLVPIVEELFYRGYVQNRLAEDLGAPSAILITALFFTFSHSQYYLLFSAWNTGMLLTILFSAPVTGYIFHRTRSLLPPMVAHALVNIPVRGLADFILPIVMIALIVIYRREIMQHAQVLVEMLKTGLLSRWGLAAICLFMILFAVGMALTQDMVVLVSFLLLIAAVILETLEKRKVRKMALNPAS